MVIENDARRYVIEAIDIEKQMQKVELNAKSSSTPLHQMKDYYELREKLLQQLCKINSVANVQGKGRDDFNIEIIERTEEIMRSTKP